LVDMTLADLAFDRGSGGAIVGVPVRVVLPGSGVGELFFVGSDVDGASALGVGALRGQTSGCAGTGAG